MKLKKTLSVLLALCLCVGMLVVGASAEDNVAEVVGASEYATLAEAFAAAGSGDTVRLLDNCSLTSTLNVSGAVTLDLNGKTVSNGFTPNSSYPLIRVLANAQLTVEGSGSIANTGAFTIYGLGKVVLNGGTISGTQYVVVNGGELVIDGATVTGMVLTVYCYSSASKTTVESGTVRTTASTTQTLSPAIYLYGGKLTVNGGTIQATQYGVVITNVGNAEINGGTVTSSGYGVLNGGVLAVTDGQISGTEYGIYNNGAANAATVTVSGGVVTGAYGVYNDGADASTEITGTADVSGRQYALLNNGGTTTISGGTVSYAGSAADGVTVAVGDGTVNVTGGTITNNTSTGSSVYLYGNTAGAPTLNVSDNATILSDAFGVCMLENGTMTMTGGTIQSDDCAVSNFGDIVAPSSISVTGGTITSGVTGIYHPGIGSVTVDGDASIIGGTSGIEMRAGTLEVRGGTIASSASSFSIQEDDSGMTVTGAALAVSQHMTNKAITVDIYGGEFDGIYAIYEEDVQDPTDGDDVIITIYGGTFTSSGAGESIDAYDVENNNDELVRVIIVGGSFDTPVPVEYAGEGFVPVDNGSGDYGVGECKVFMGGEADSSKIRGDLYFKIPDVADSANYTVTFNGDEPVNLGDMDPDAVGFRFSFSVFAKNMGDTFTYDLSYKGTTVKSGVVSIAAYAEHLAEHYPEYEQFANAMLVYGAAAQIQFGYDTDNLVSDADLSDLAPVEGTRFNSAAIRTDMAANASIPVDYSAMTVTFVADTTLSVAFCVRNVDESAAALEWVEQNVTLDSAAVNGGTGVTGTVVDSIRGGVSDPSVKYVIISKTNVAISDFNEPQALVINGVGTYYVSVLNYLAAAEESGTPSLRALARALYAYANEAEALLG